jgi:hypothetical protein
VAERPGIRGLALAAAFGYTPGLSGIRSSWGTGAGLDRRREPIAGYWDGADGLGSFIPVMQVQQLYEDVPRPQREIEVYKEQTRRATEYAVNHPLDEALLIPKKLYHFYRDDSRPLVWVQDNEGRPEIDATAEQWLRDIANTYYFAVVAGTLLGIPLWVSLRAPKKLLFVMLVLYYSFMFGFVFIGEPRFHSVLIPPFALFAAASLVWAGDHLARSEEVRRPERRRPQARGRSRVGSEKAKP